MLQKITAEEVEGLEGFFAKSYHGKKSVTVSAERFSQALLSSRFSNMTPEHLLELYFREKLVGKKEERQLEEQKKDRFYNTGRKNIREHLWKKSCQNCWM